ncbi:cation diffusion facilitator family transporter [soil metagenome]
MAASEKQSVALLSMAASAILALAKLAAGLVTGSLGILSEAIQSAIDCGATIITFFAIRYGDQPPDEEHHYGHAKFESVAALVEALLLLGTALWIIYEAVKRLYAGSAHIDLAWWAFAIVIASIAIDFNRSRTLRRVGLKTSSEALLADSVHFAADMWSSLAVLIGLLAVWAGYPWADSIAGLVVAVMIIKAAFTLGKRTLDTLLDAAPQEASETVRRLIEGFDGVLSLERLRIRPAGPILFVSVVVSVRRTMPIDDLVQLREAIAARIISTYPNADVTVTADPVTLDDESIAQKIMLIASRKGLAIHHLTIQRIADRTAISFDLEVPGEMPLQDAHACASDLEHAIKREVGEDIEVESHIEPLPDPLIEGEAVEGPERDRIETVMRRLANPHPMVTDLHNIRVRRSGGRLYVHYHCRFAPAETVERVHDVIDRIEAALQDEVPAIKRVIAHAEPLRN